MKKISLNTTCTIMRLAPAFLGLVLSSTTIEAKDLKLTPRYNAEGVLHPKHDLSLEKIRRQYFLNDKNQLDLTKLQQARIFLSSQLENLKESARLSRKTNLIFVHGYLNEEAQEEGQEALDKEAESLAPFIFALEVIDDLIKNSKIYSDIQIHKKVETALLWYAAAYTDYPMGRFSSEIERGKQVAENFFEFNLNDSEDLQASNLIVNGRFASQEDLKKVRAQGQDISKFNPPSSAIWENNPIESFDPENEEFFGLDIFPSRAVALPEFHYERMGNGQDKFKTHWFDTQEMNKKGKPKKKKVTLRVGFEAYAGPVTNNIARALGYPAIPSAFRSQVKLNLGEKSFESFLAEFRIAHGNEQGSLVNHIQRFPGENAVILKNVALEAYPDDEDYRKIGPFRMGDNGLRNRREYRALVLYNALISLQDHFEYQSRVDAIRDPKTSEWQPLFFISDTGSSLGIPTIGNIGAVNEFTWEFTKRSDEKLRLFWFSFFNHRTWKDTTYSDVKWLARRMARLSSSQIDGIMKISGFPAPARALYAEKIKSRLNQMMKDFDLTQEGYRPHTILSKKQLAAQHPEFIDEKGFLKERAQEYPGNTLPILGEKFTVYQGLIVKALNVIQNRLLKVATPADLPSGGVHSMDLGRLQTEKGLLFGGSRSVSINSEVGPHQKRYLLRDRFTVSIPFGFITENLQTPLAAYYTYSFEYTHSVSNMSETAKTRFFGLMNPFSIREIRRNLNQGEQLSVSHSMGAAVGTAKFKINEDVKVEAALFGLAGNSIKETYFAKTSDDILEVATNASQNFKHQTGADARLVVQLGAMLSHDAAKTRYRLYRIDLLNASPTKKHALEESFAKALVYNDFADLNNHVHPTALDEDSLRRSFSVSLILWKFGSNKTVRELNLNGQSVFAASEVGWYDRIFDRLWTDKNNPNAPVKSALNFMGSFLSEGELVETNFEGGATKDFLSFESSQLHINLTKFDSYATRKEFDKDIKGFFNSRSGMQPYFNYQMPAAISGYPDLAATMRWQLSQDAIIDILKAAGDWKNLTFLAPTSSSEVNYGMQIDPREEISFRATRALRGADRSLSMEDRKKALRESASDILFVINKVIGPKAERISLLRKWTTDDKIWVITSASGALDLSIPSMREQKNQLYFAPEIGKYQGPGYLEKFRRQQSITPILVH